MQYYKYGKIKNWKAVGGAAVQGAIVGGVAGLTGGTSLIGTGTTAVVRTAAISGTSNALGGAVNDRIQGKKIALSSVSKDFLIGFVTGGLFKIGSNAFSKFLSSSVGQSLEKRISSLAKNLNIYSGQKTLNTKEGAKIVETYYNQMKSGEFGKNIGAGGFVDKTGKIILTDGNHKMNAAMKYALETGDKKYIEQLISKGSFTKNVSDVMKDYGIKTYNLPTK